MPDLAGRSPAEAPAILERSRLRLGGTRTEPGDGAEGRILRTEPAAGSVVVIGTAVTAILAARRPPPQLTMPRLVGSPFPLAARRLQAMDLPAPQRDVAPSDRPANEVIGQSPSPGQPISRRTLVQLRVSDGTLVRVPALARRSPEEAREILRASRLALGSESSEPASLPEGLIVRTSPGRGALVPRGSAVDYVVAAPRQRAVMPPVTGLPLARAQARLREARLQFPVTRTSPSSRPADEVVAQVPEAGQPVTMATRITLTLSDGSLVTTPPLVGKTLEEARSDLAAVDLRPGAGAREPSDGPPGRILRTNPAAGQEVARGSAVDYVLAVRSAPPPPAPAGPDAAGPQPPPGPSPRPSPPVAPASGAPADQAPSASQAPAAALPLGPPSSPAEASRGADLVATPLVTGRRAGEAQDELTRLGLVARMVSPGTGAWATGRVGRQQPAAGALIRRGGSVVLYMEGSYLPLALGGLALAGAAAVLGWTALWPLRVTVAPGPVEDVACRCADDDLVPAPALGVAWVIPAVGGHGGQLAAAGGAIDPKLVIRAAWTIDIGDFTAHDGTAEAGARQKEGIDA